MSELQVNKIRLEDLAYQKSLEIRKKVFVEEQGVPLELEISNEEDCKHFLATLNGNCVATARYRLKGHVAKIERVATLQEFRGRGIAKNIMEAIVEDIARLEQVSLPLLHSQESATGFYLNLGWKVFGSDVIEAGIVHQKMIYIERLNTNEIDELKTKLINYSDLELCKSL